MYIIFNTHYLSIYIVFLILPLIAHFFCSFSHKNSLNFAYISIPISIIQFQFHENVQNVCEFLWSNDLNTFGTSYLV